MSRQQNIFFIVPFILIVIFGGTLAYFSFNESLKKIRAVTVENISRRADDLPPQINRNYSKRVSIDLEAVSVVAEFDDGKTYEYWTFNKQVPGPFVRVMENDTVNIALTHLRKMYKKSKIKGAHNHGPGDIERIRSIKIEDREDSNSLEYSINLQNAFNLSGEGKAVSVGPGKTKSFEFEAIKPGIYIYNSGGVDTSVHIARGLYGMMLVEPKGGLSKVDKEYYVMEGEIYTDKDIKDSGFYKLDEKGILAKNPDYHIFNGHINALKDNGAMKADVGDVVRIFFGNSGQLDSNLHIIGGIFDSVYSQRDLISPILKNVQTVIVPAGDAVMVEIVTDVPRKLFLTDNAVGRDVVGELVVE